MKTVEDTTENYKSNNLDSELTKNYKDALKDDSFASLVKKLKVDDKVLKKYTTKLQNTVSELENCKKCRSLLECKNKFEGCVNFPKVDGDIIRFDYVACKYKQNALEEEKYVSNTYGGTLAIKSARMADIYTDDKKRMHIIRWAKNFFTGYQKDQHIKGCYLHGSFGSGKSYILAALLNELARKKVNTTIIYFPEMLRTLKESFYDDFDVKMNMLKTTDVLLIDDIGAETVTSWSRDEILGTILQYRMDSKLPTLFTSNLTIEELEIHLSSTKNSVDIVKAKRIIERIKQLTDDLELISDNRRE